MLDASPERDSLDESCMSGSQEVRRLGSGYCCSLRFGHTKFLYSCFRSPLLLLSFLLLLLPLLRLFASETSRPCSVPLFVLFYYYYFFCISCFGL